MRPISDIKILVVDDHREMITLIRGLLLQFGYIEIDDANDGPSALVKLRADAYDLVISDLIMQPVDGLALLREIRGDAALRSLPFVMVTASSEARHIVAAKEAGVTAYILKPFTATLLRQRIDTALTAKSCANVPDLRRIFPAAAARNKTSRSSCRKPLSMACTL